MGLRELPAQHPAHHRRGDGAITRSFFALTIVAAVGLALAPLPRDVVERVYSDGFYGWLQPRLTFLTDLVPWAVLDALVALAVTGVLLRLVRGIAGEGARGPGLVRRLLRETTAAMVIVSGGYLVFLALWGFNYRRTPVEARVDFDRGRVTPARVLAMAEQATQALNHLHGGANVDPWPELARMPAVLGPSFTATTASLGLSWMPRPGRAKPTLLGPYFRWAGIAGLTNPFGLEVIPSPDTLPFERHAIMAHEWSHLAGFAHEAEAGFVGWLACLAGDAQARYSGWMSVWPSLAAAVPADARRRLVQRLGAGPRADLRAIVARNARAVPVIRDAAWRSYDAYLRSQHVPEGVASYEGVVRLIAGTRPIEPGR